MNWAFAFMVTQMVLCIGGAVAFGFQGGWDWRAFWTAWIWGSYAQANVGFAMLALR
jgi:hypothetical protein